MVFILIKNATFIKLPSPYSKTILLKVNESCTFKELKALINEQTCYENIKYYLIYGTGVINECYDDLSIEKYNELNPSKKITDEFTLILNVRNIQ